MGKTALASALAEAMDAPLIRLQCYEGIDASQALYDWDFPRQLLHLRAAEAAGVTDADRLEGELYDRRFLVTRPLLRALETQPSVLLVDEIDRADDEFEAFLLELLSEYTITIPELGTLRAQLPPVVVLTSNRTREVHDALKRRCLYHWFDHPGFARELAIVRRRFHGTERLAEQVTALAQALRAEDLVKPPPGSRRPSTGRRPWTRWGRARWTRSWRCPGLGAEVPGGHRAGTGAGSGGDPRGTGDVSGVIGRRGGDGRSRGEGKDGGDKVGQARAVDASAVVVGFARALRAAGVDASPDRVQAFLGALDTLIPVRARTCTGRAVSPCAGARTNLEYERVFAAYFGGRPGGAPCPVRSPPRTRTVLRGAGTSPRRGPRTPYPWPCWPTPPTYCATGTSPS